MIPEGAFLLVTGQIDSRHLRPRTARMSQRATPPPRSMVGTRWRAEWIVQPRDRTNDAFPSPGGTRERAGVSRD